MALWKKNKHGFGRFLSQVCFFIPNRRLRAVLTFGFTQEIFDFAFSHLK